MSQGDWPPVCLFPCSLPLTEKCYFEWQLQEHQLHETSFRDEECTLNDEQYQTIRAEKTSQEKMRKLYELVRSWGKRQKDRLYQALKETNRDLVEELEGGHFVDRHREKLIQQVSEVVRVLKLLRGHTLTPRQYQSISTRRSNVEKMQKLYELVPSWRKEQKDQLYRVLWITNRALADECAGASIPAQELSTSTSLGATREHFVERHREQLIQRASSVDRILDVLKRGHDPWLEEHLYPVWHPPYKNLTEELEETSKSTTGELLQNRGYILNDEQYQTIRAEKTNQEKMRKLYELVPSWDERQKDRLYQALTETNRDLVEELEGGHFVDQHREKLIQRVSEVDRVLKLLRGHTLTPEQYQSISTGRSNVEKMQKLYELVPSWQRDQKDQLYRVLWITNRALADECADASIPAQELSTSTSLGATREHFVERHREQLIQRASSVDKTLDVLKRGHDPWLEEQLYRVWQAPYESPTEELEGSMKKLGPMSQASMTHSMFLDEGSQVAGQAAGLDTTPDISMHCFSSYLPLSPSPLLWATEGQQQHDFYGSELLCL